MSDDEITMFAAVDQWARVPRHVERKNRHEEKAAMRLRALALRKLGLTVSAIAKELEVSVQTATRWTW